MAAIFRTTEVTVAPGGMVVSYLAVIPITRRVSQTKKHLNIPLTALTNIANFMSKLLRYYGERYFLYDELPENDM